MTTLLYLLIVTFSFTLIRLLSTARVGDLRNVKYRLTLYNTYHIETVKNETMAMQYDCLYYDIIDNLFSMVYDDEYVWSNQLMTYCIRPYDLDSQFFTANFDSQQTKHQNYTFTQLKRNNISSIQLFDWSAPIDVVESYQAYLDEEDESMTKHTQTTPKMNFVFYNCTPPSFGTFCQYYFASQPISLEEYIELTYNYIFFSYPPVAPCYIHLSCEGRIHYYDCLNWREICDGKIDCFYGEDEENCWQLEANQCEDNEYRCHSGQCIPLDFRNDDNLNPDCIDQTDEPHTRKDSDRCSIDGGFRCEETSCYPLRGKDLPFSCGDGNCIADFGECINERQKYAPRLEDRFTLVNTTLSCSQAMVCFVGIKNRTTSCFCEWDYDESCESIVETECPSDVFLFPTSPILFSHIYFVYEGRSVGGYTIMPSFICFNPDFCTTGNRRVYYISQHACVKYKEVFDSEFLLGQWDEMIAFINVNISDVCKPIMFECPHPSLYRCNQSFKCISVWRLLDGVQDCHMGDDENFMHSCSLNWTNQYSFKCFGEDRCLSTLMINDGLSDCKNGEDEMDPNKRYLQNHITFPFICDGHQDMLPILIDGRNETDENNCERWLCNNSYTHCNSVWNCPKGEDELQCKDASFVCPPLQHPCISPVTFNLSCLSIEKVNDNIMDCLGGSDERQLCRQMHPLMHEQRYHCWNQSQCVLINSMHQCGTKTDNMLRSYIRKNFDCNTKYNVSIEEHLCSLIDKRNYHLLGKPATHLPSNSDYGKISHRKFSQSRSNPVARFDNPPFCGRGLPLSTITEPKEICNCLCPPNTYGDQCELENQRVSLTVQPRSASDWRSMFTFIFILITDQNEIESSDHRYYSPSTDCAIKWNIYLLYQSRPKNPTRNYSVRVDVYKRETFKLEYRGSWYYPLNFSFLPVHRLAVQITIPAQSVTNQNNICPIDCHNHGLCIAAISRANKTIFICRCYPGWVGDQCQHAQQSSPTCSCAPGSICISSFPTSLCVCPLGRGGPRCYIRLNPCEESGECLNGGRCVPADERRHFFFVKKCVCKEDFWGENCELSLTKLTISFHYEVSISPLAFLYIIQETFHPGNQRTITLLKKILPYEDTVTFRTAVDKFDLTFIELDTDYYQIDPEGNINNETLMTVYRENRCLPIEELFNSTFIHFHLLQRIKYYHVPCQEYQDLSCFFDAVHMCTCNRQRQANCILFDHNKTTVCQENYGSCENGGRCFQDNTSCPTMSACHCQDCFFGTKCQFSSRGFSLSLDAILGYQIRPNSNLQSQSNAVKFCLVLVPIMFTVGLFSGLLSILTFSHKEPRKVACGVYLLYTSIASVLTTTMLTLKFIFLLLIQLGITTDQLFLLVQCTAVDFFLRILLNFGDWLNACVAVERAVTVLQGINYESGKNKRSAKWVVVVLFLVIVVSNLHDSIHRHVISDEEDNRTWCIVRYSWFVQVYNNIIQVVYFVVPFLCNIVSALIIIITITRKRSRAQKHRSFKSHFHEQLSHNKHLLISSIILVLLALPRLIISLMSKCMTSTREPWLFLIGYFTSFIPSILVFVVFILPSQIYKTQFKQALGDYCRLFYQRK